MKPFLILAGGLAVIGVLTTPASAQSLKKYHDKVSFLADTAAANASGALPNFGMIVRDSQESFTLGALTFSLAPGGDYIASGAAGTPAAPDWYPETPGADLAMGWEHMQVTSLSPMHSFGLDIVEPNETMPAW